MYAAQTFPCPACREFINDQMSVCRYCNAPVDAHAAAAAVAEQDIINRACNSASLVRNLAGAAWVFFFLRLVLFAAAGFALYFGVVGIPVWILFWLIKYGGIRTDDVDYKRARRNVFGAGLLWALLVVALLVFELFFAGALASLG